MSIEERAKELNALADRIGLDQLQAITLFLTENFPAAIDKIIGTTPSATKIREEGQQLGKNLVSATAELASLCDAIRAESKYHQR